MSAARSAAVGLKFAWVTSVNGVSVRSVQLRLPIVATVSAATESFETMCRIGDRILVARIRARVMRAFVIGSLSEGDSEANRIRARGRVLVSVVVPRSEALG